MMTKIALETARMSRAVGRTMMAHLRAGLTSKAAAAVSVLLVLGLIGTTMQRGSNPAALQAAGGPTVTIDGPLPLPVTGSVNVGNFPATQGVTFNGIAQPVNVANTSPLQVQNASGSPAHLVHDGKSFNLAPNPNIGLELDLPTNVVLTDVVLTLTQPSLATTIFVSEFDRSKTYAFEAVGSPGSTWAGTTDGKLALHFESGLQSNGGLAIGLTCNNIGGNSCAGALMWSGYQP